jgi:hypothetical protein
MRIQATAFGFTGWCALLALSMGGCGGVVDKQAETHLYEAIGNTSITVFPAFVRDGDGRRYDADAANAIGAFLAQEELATVTVSNAEVPITGQWGANQAKMFRDSAADLGNFVRQNPIQTDYALLPEYLIGGRELPVGVHLYLVDAEGTVAYALLFNSHHQEFRDVDPQTVQDCTTILINRLRADLVDGSAAKAAAAATKKIRTDSSLTVFPVLLPGGPAKNVGDALGLVLETQLGMSDIYPTDLVFSRPSEAEFDQVPKLFGEFVRHNAGAIETEYALYAEILGTRNPPQVNEVRAVLVDRDGTCVWADRQQPDDPDFKRIDPREPMTCCVLVSERLRRELDTTAPAKTPAGAGRMARLWAEKSGLPDQAERDAMEQRQQTFRHTHKTARVRVYPVQLIDELDTNSATYLANLLNDQDLCQAEAADAQPRFEIAPSSNEQRRLWDLARAVRDYVRSEPPDTDYALFAEYTIRPSDQQVWTVHFVVCDRVGQWVIVDFQNEHQPDFRRLDPKTRDDCGALIAERLAHYLR